MKNIISVLFFFLCFGFINAQDHAISQGKTVMIPMDTIIKINGDTLIVNVKYKDFDEIIFFYPYNNTISKETIPTIREMRYSNGMVVYMGNNQKESKDALKTQEIKNDTAAWNKVIVIYSLSELPANPEGRGEVIIDYTGEFNADNNLLEKKCLVILKKKAVKMDANYVVITNKNFRRDFGELPVIEINGNTYFVKEKK